MMHFFIKNILTPCILSSFLFFTPNLYAAVPMKKIEVPGGGFGGNEKIGQLSYDDLVGHLASFPITRDNKSGMCYLENANFKVVVIISLDEQDPDKDVTEEVSFTCLYPDPVHNHLYWSGSITNINGGYSPANDALYAATVANKMFNEWYGISLAVDLEGKPKQINLRVNDPIYVNRASVSDYGIDMGQGGKDYYPSTTLDTVSHELGHIFTFHNSTLFYKGASGNIDESFADMQAAAVEYFLSGKNKWVFGADKYKSPLYCEQHPEDCIVRYMDDPTKDGHTIDNVKNINEDDINAPGSEHKYIGIFDKAFYLLATSPGWNTKMAFDVMVRANQVYWFGENVDKVMNFTEGACGVIAAAKEYQEKNSTYTLSAVINAFKNVGFVETGDHSTYDIKGCE